MDNETRLKALEDALASAKLQQLTNPLDYVSREIIREHVTIAINERFGSGFGGDGSDGELNISSGTTTINASNAAVVVKQYRSISIIGTATLTISNPHANGTILVLKSQGNVILTSTTPINLKGLGGTGGTPSNDGSSGNSPLRPPAGGDGGASPDGAGGLAGNFFSGVVAKIVPTACGAGGGGGDRVGGGGGVASGGNGGGSVYIECAKALSFTGTNTVAGNNGDNNGAGNDGGGGGGGGGSVVILYRTLTANTGTNTVTGGSGGTGAGASPAGGGGGGGASANGANRSGGTGGAGGTGLSLITQNLDFL